MTTWRYIKGSEKDFEGAPDWASMMMEFEGQTIFEEHVTPLTGISRFSIKGDKSVEVWDDNTVSGGTIIAQREPVGTDDSKYNRPCKGITIDVYDVLKAFNVTCPALQHLIKKALAVGQRGHKDASEDLKDILASAKRAIELSEGDK
uniref:Uncharacterized protein n=1 Tax=Klebsiella phage phiYH65 TaxID=3237693 RepID=A0AB39ACH1_9CAUD